MRPGPDPAALIRSGSARTAAHPSVRRVPLLQEECVGSAESGPVAPPQRASRGSARQTDQDLGGAAGLRHERKWLLAAAPGRIELLCDLGSRDASVLTLRQSGLGGWPSVHNPSTRSYASPRSSSRRVSFIRTTVLRSSRCRLEARGVAGRAGDRRAGCQAKGGARAVLGTLLPARGRTTSGRLRFCRSWEGPRDGRVRATVLDRHRDRLLALAYA